VTLVTSAQYEPLSATHGFGFRSLVSEEEHHELFSHPDFWNPLKTAPRMARWGVRFIGRQYDLLAGLIREDTIMVASPGVLAAAMIHEKLGVPWANLILQPWMIPSSIVRPVMPGLTWLHRAPLPLWKLFCLGLDLLGYFLIERRLNRLRLSLGLRPVRRIFWNWLSPQLVLGMFPEWFGKPQADWPPQMRLTGFPLFDGLSTGDMDGRLLEFCRAGTPPVAFTFGTGMAHPAALFQSALEACERLGLRAVFLTKFRDQLPERLLDSIFHTSFAPFGSLFPHCAAVVHHGGIGTVAKALSAGTPQVICPLCFDLEQASVCRTPITESRSPPRCREC
jgi:rhamnosyltransferase subunit B